MKRAILFFYIMLAAHMLHAQKKLSELQVTLDSTEFEEVSSSSLPALIEQEKRKGEKFKRFYDIVRHRNDEHNKIFRLKETGELITVTSLLHKENKEDWDKTVRTAIATFSSKDYGGEDYVEYLEGETYRAAIFFTKVAKHGVSNHIMYKNPKKEAFLAISYTSDQPDEVKVENLRKIVKGLRID